MSDEVKNLDALINEIGFEIAQIIDENMINKILGVLANDGVYAMWVYCLNKLTEKDFSAFLKQLSVLPIKIIDKENNNEIELVKEDIEQYLNLLDEINEIKNDKTKNEELKQKRVEKQEYFIKFEQFFQNLSADIHQLLFFKDMVEKALIYARYHAKAMGD